MKNSQSTTLEQKKDRRSLLVLIGAGGAAAVAALFSRNGGAEAGHDATNVFHLGEDNTAIPSATTIRTANVDDAALAGVNTNSGDFPIGVGGIASTAPAAAATAQFQELGRTLIDGHSQAKSKMLATIAAVRQGDVVVQQEVGNGIGVVGLGDSSGVIGVGVLAGVLGASDGGFGVFGFDDSLSGVAGASGSGIGVVGASDTGTGVRGTGKPGVYGLSSNGAGVRGDGTGKGSTGVFAKNSGTRKALRVEGRASFKQAGTITFKAGQQGKQKTLPFNLANGSLVVATLQNDAGSGVVVRTARKSASNRIRVVLNKAVAAGRTGRVAYFIFTA